MIAGDNGTIPLFWWREEPNFGDALSPWLMEQLLGTATHWSRDAGKLVGLGSVLWSATSGDVVWGTGLHPFTDRWFPNWSPAGVTFLAVRGPLTREYVQARGGTCPAIYGDPAELLPHYYSPAETEPSAIGIVPHIYDEEGRKFASNAAGVTTIDPRHRWQKVVDQIAACEMIWSSSLHGIIVAEAYGIPAIWIGCSEGKLKYRDYYLSSGRAEVHPVAWDKAAVTLPPPLPPRVPLGEHPLVQSLRQWQEG